MKIRFLIISFFILNSAIAQVSDFKHIDFTIADNNAKLQEGKSIANLPLLAHRLTHTLQTDVEKFRAIYFWVSNNIKGDNVLDAKVTKKRKKLKNDSLAYAKWNASYKKIAFKKLLKKKKTMCTGYAYLIKELCFLANIESVIINGYGRSTEANVFQLELVNHSWNAVKLNNKWYVCDATWSSGYFLNDSVFISDYNDGYFLTDPVLFAKNHFPIQKKWLLDTTQTVSSFTSFPLVYSETFTHKILPVHPKKMELNAKTNEEIQFHFKTLKKSTTKNISLISYTGAQEKVFPIYHLNNENGSITFKHHFKKKGFYDVHVKVDEAIIASYTITVSKS